MTTKFLSEILPQYNCPMIMLYNITNEVNAVVYDTLDDVLYFTDDFDYVIDIISDNTEIPSENLDRFIVYV